MKNSILFLICPDCNIELIIKKHFQGDLFFLTALGSVFDTSTFDDLKGVNIFLSFENIKEIIIVNDTSCRFIQSVLTNYKGYKTYAEEIMRALHSESQIEILSETEFSRKAFTFAELNIKQQAHAISESGTIGNKIEKGEIRLRGMIYERYKNIFTEIILD